MATPGKAAAKELKKRMQVKTSFNSPFTIHWTTLPQEDMHFILKTLTDKFTSIGLEKKEVKVFHRRGRKKEKKPAPNTECNSVDIQESEPPKNGWTHVTARRQLAIGINEVTKALERNELHLALVCKSVRPKHMCDHLITLSATRRVPACQVPRLSQSLSTPLGLKSVLALGFRRCPSKDEEIFAETVETIKPRVPALNVAWLQEATASVESLLETEEKAEIGTMIAQKRKIGESEIIDCPFSFALQPLKVKRIVANPSKRRKV